MGSPRYDLVDPKLSSIGKAQMEQQEQRPWGGTEPGESRA